MNVDECDNSMKRLFSMTEDAMRTIEMTDHGISILTKFIKGIIILVK